VANDSAASPLFGRAFRDSAPTPNHLVKASTRTLKAAANRAPKLCVDFLRMGWRERLSEGASRLLQSI